MQKMLTTLVQLSKNKYIEKETGYLICENAVLGSTGYQEYFAGELGLDKLSSNTKVKVYRPEEEVFKPESLATLENKAICLLHPEEMVNASNDSQLRKGMVYNVRREGNVIKGTLQVTDKDTIDKINYIRCLSLGYDLDLDNADENNDDGTIFIARNIRYNHVALVPKGRSKVAMITDSAAEDIKNKQGGEFMSLFQKNARGYDESEEERKRVERRDEREGAEEDTITKEIERKIDKVGKSQALKDLKKLLRKLEEGEYEEIDEDYKEREADDACESKSYDEDKRERRDEREDERRGAKEDTVTKEIERRVKKGDRTDRDEEKDVEKLRSKKGREELEEDYDERREYERKKARDNDITISAKEYKSLLMAQKGMVYGNDTSAFTKTETKSATAMDAEAERRAYYKQTLNPHANPNWRAECVQLNDVII